VKLPRRLVWLVCMPVILAGWLFAIAAVVCDYASDWCMSCLPKELR
jgi:hypothetical protein